MRLFFAPGLATVRGGPDFLLAGDEFAPLRGGELNADYVVCEKRTAVSRIHLQPMRAFIRGVVECTTRAANPYFGAHGGNRVEQCRIAWN